MYEIAHNLWTFEITLPENPLKWLNCYVVRDVTGGRNLLIDTGFYRSECLNELLQNMQELNLTPDNTDVFITHVHSDHSGNAGYLHQLGYNIIMGKIDYDLLSVGMENLSQNGIRRMAAEGMPMHILQKIKERDSVIMTTSGPFQAKTVNDGDYLQYGEFNFRCIHTPGHTPGHICLYDEEKKTILLGDHVIFEITPNITTWKSMPDSLGVYLESLKKLRGLDIEYGLTSHRGINTFPLHERLERLIAHHERRLVNAIETIRDHPGSTAYEIASIMRWKIRANSWEEFPPSQQYFATNETAAHLDYLRLRGKIYSVPREDGVPLYYVM